MTPSDSPKMKTVGSIREEIGVYNKTLNNYIRTFNLKVFNKKYLVDYKWDGYYQLRDYHQATPELEEYLQLHKSRLVEYERDYYSWKTPVEIALKIDMSVETVLDYLNRNISRFEYFHVEGNDFNKQPRVFEKAGYNNLTGVIDDKIVETSRVKEFSSYQLLQDLQHARLEELIDRAQNKNL